MCVTRSPAADNFLESLNTLRYANRAKLIKTQAVINEGSNSLLVLELRKGACALSRRSRTRQSRQARRVAGRD